MPARLQGGRNARSLLTGREVEGVEQVVKSRAVRRNVRMLAAVTGFGKLSRLRAVSGVSPQLRSMNLIIETWSHTGGDVSTCRIRRHDQQWNARTVAEEVDRLDVARVIVAAAFVESDKDAVLPTGWDYPAPYRQSSW